MSSFLVAVPEALQGAAQDLAGIGSTLSEATAGAAVPTTGIVAAAEDEISAAIAKIFGNYGQEFQALSAQAQAFHAQFANSLHAGAGAYLGTEIANIEQLGQSLGGAVTGAAHSAAVPIQATSVGSLLGGVEASVQHSLSGIGAALQTGGVGAAVRALQAALPAQTGLPGLISNTTTNLEDLFAEIASNPFPVLTQFFANQMRYLEQIMTNLPGNLANLPGLIQTSIGNLMHFGSLAMTTIQTGLVPLFQSLGTAITDFPGLLLMAGQQLLAGNIPGALGDLGTAFFNFVLQPPFFTIDTITSGTGFTITPHLVGPLADLANAILVPGKLFQDFATAVGIHTVPGMIAQNIGNGYLTLTKLQIDLGAELGDFTTTFPFISATISPEVTLPIQIALAALGAPVAGLLAPGGVIPTITTIMSDLGAGNTLGAFNTLFGAPVSITNAFLNESYHFSLSIPIPNINETFNIPTSGITLPNLGLGTAVQNAVQSAFNALGDVPVNVSLTGLTAGLDLPFDGLLVPQTPIGITLADHLMAGTGPIPVTITLPFVGQQTITIPAIPIINQDVNIPITVGGTPVSGLAKALFVFAPREFANAIGLPPGEFVDPPLLPVLANALTPPTGSVAPPDLAA